MDQSDTHSRSFDNFKLVWSENSRKLLELFRPSVTEMQRKSVFWRFILHCGINFRRKFNRYAMHLIYLVGGVSLSACAVAVNEDATGDPDQVRSVFEASVFNADGKIVRSSLNRWCEAPVLQAETSGDETLVRIGEIATGIETLTGLPFLDANQVAQEPTYRVYEGLDMGEIAETGAFDGLQGRDLRRLKASRCFFRLAVDQGCIPRALIIVPAGLSPDVTEHCLLEEMTQSMGMIGDSDFPFPSLYSERDELANRTLTDDRALQLLYHPALRPGQTLEDVRPLLDAAIADLNS